MRWIYKAMIAIRNVIKQYGTYVQSNAVEYKNVDSVLHPV